MIWVRSKKLPMSVIASPPKAGRLRERYCCSTEERFLPTVEMVKYGSFRNYDTVCVPGRQAYIRIEVIS